MKIQTWAEFLQALYPESWDQDFSDVPGVNQEWKLVSHLAASLEELPDAPQNPSEQIRLIQSLPCPWISSEIPKTVAVILAAGKGTRMGSGIQQKVVSPIAGVPAIVRAVDTYRSFGIRDLVIVVGIGYKQVLEHLRECDLNITYLYQTEQKGTGHAGRLAARCLRFLGYSGDVLVVMGDKYITRRALVRLYQDHSQLGADLTLSVGHKKDWPDSGRVVMDDSGHVRAIIEKPDIVQKHLWSDFLHWPQDPVPGADFLAHAKRLWNREDKLKKILGEPFWQCLQDSVVIPKNSEMAAKWNAELQFEITESRRLSGEEVENDCDWVNLSVYLFKSRVLYQSVEALQPNNAQKELYLTDAAKLLASHRYGQDCKVIASKMPDGMDIMGFNTPEELEQIERHVQKENQ